METNLLQKNILKKKIKGSIPLDNKTTLPLLKQKTPEDYPELRRAAEGLQSPEQIRTLRGTRPINDLNAAEKAFGPDKMSNPEFKKGLRKIQEKYKVSAYA